MEHIVFLTGRLAQASLERVLASIADAPFTWEVREIGLQVAALMTADMVQRRVAAPVLGADSSGARSADGRGAGGGGSGGGSGSGSGSGGGGGGGGGQAGGPRGRRR